MTKLGEFMVNAAIKSLKAGAILESVAINYVGNYCTKGWITDDEMEATLERIVSIAAGEGDPEEPEPEAEEPATGDTAEEITEEATEETETDYSSMTVTALKELAKERGLSGYSTKTRAELVAMLEADDAEKAAEPEAEVEEAAEEETAEPEEAETTEEETEESAEPETAEESVAVEAEEETGPVE